MNKVLPIAIACAALLAGCDQSPPAPDKTIQQLMAEDVETTAQIYWKSIQYISDETGDHDIFPRNDAEWARVEAAANRLVELGEVLKTPGYADGRGEDWIELADGLIAQSKRAAQAAAAHDKEAVFKEGGTLYNVCTACHQIYPPAEGEPGKTAAG